MSLQKLKEQKADAVARMEAALAKAEQETRDLTAEEIKDFDDAKAEVARLDDQIKRHESVAVARADLDKVTPAVSRAAMPVARPAGDPAKKEFENLGEFLSAVRFNPGDQRLDWQQKDMRSENRFDTGTAGGFAIPKQFIPTLRQVNPQNSIIRPRATVIPAGDTPDAEVTMPALNQGATENIYGGVQVTWTSEGTTIAETDVTIREISLKPQEVSGFITVTDKLLRNWGAAASLLETQLRLAINGAEEQKFLKGSGTGCPLGILNSAGTIAYNRNTSSQIKYVDLINMLAKAWDDGNLVWMYNPTCLPQLMKLSDDDGRLIWMPSAREGEPSMLLGRPAIPNRQCPVLGTKGDLVLASLSNYLIKDGSGPIVSASEHVEFKKNKTLIKVVWNVDGQSWLNAPIEGEDEQLYSPFVALDVPAGT